MTSFPSQALRVRDRSRTPVRRLHALRECALHVTPYGFRATWHHLVVSARIPQDLDADPESLVRAVAERARVRGRPAARVCGLRRAPRRSPGRAAREHRGGAVEAHLAP